MLPPRVCPMNGFKECLREKCAWYDLLMERCAILGLNHFADTIGKRLDIIARKVK